MVNNPARRLHKENMLRRIHIHTHTHMNARRKILSSTFGLVKLAYGMHIKKINLLELFDLFICKFAVYCISSSGFGVQWHNHLPTHPHISSYYIKMYTLHTQIYAFLFLLEFSLSIKNDLVVHIKWLCTLNSTSENSWECECKYERPSKKLSEIPTIAAYYWKNGE